jgi:hypothetical protein
MVNESTPAVFKWRMLETGKSDQGRRDDLLFSVALCLVVAVVLVIIGAVLTSGSFSPISARDRLELISGQSANFVTAALVLAAVVALSFVAPERMARARPVLGLSFLVATVIALLATYSVVDILTVHIPSVGSDTSLSIGISHGSSVGTRLGTMLPQAGTAFIALVAMVSANRAGNAPRGVNGSRGISGDQPD